MTKDFAASVRARLLDDAELEPALKEDLYQFVSETSNWFTSVRLHGLVVKKACSKVAKVAWLIRSIPLRRRGSISHARSPAMTSWRLPGFCKGTRR